MSTSNTPEEKVALILAAKDLALASIEVIPIDLDKYKRIDNVCSEISKRFSIIYEDITKRVHQLPDK